jgi:hydrogenase-4 component B
MGGDLAHTTGLNLAALFATGLLAFIGGLAALCFVRLVGIVLLGEPRSPQAAHAHESSLGMLLPMLALGAAVVVMAVIPDKLLQMIAPVTGQLFGARVAANVAHAQASVHGLGLLNAAVWAGLGLAAVVWLVFRRKPAAPVEPVETWGCGYAAPTPRMQYTARSFSEFVSYRLFPRSLRVRTDVQKPDSVFPRKGTFSSQCPDPLTDRIYEPLFIGWADRFARLRWIQQGALHIYFLYIFVVAVAALAWISWSNWMAP